MSRAKGLTLVELLIAMVLGVFVLTAVLGVFVSSSASVTSTGQYNQIQESARLALRLMSDDLSQAGFYAGLTGTSLTTRNVGVDAVVNNDCAGLGLNNASLPAARGYFRFIWSYRQTSEPLMTCARHALPGSHVLQVKRLLGPDVAVAALDDNRYYLVGNHAQARLFAGNQLAPTLTQGRYWQWQHRVYYVERRDDGIPVLKWRQLYVNGGMVEEELVEGVEMLQFRFAVDSLGDGQVDSYMTASALSEAQWDGALEVMAVTLYLVVRAANDDAAGISDGSVRLTLPDGVLTYGDGIPRRLFSTTVMVRNAALVAGGAG
ncbi:type IV pilus assembly protein PilW [Ferrimonas sediminum]|uniref:Type IV pilus assembly protein PilW n=1 Tax=Ferrimonas sediminum TaxID=718193 RepID=A0A1G8ZBQ9_9GAMM|nr:PilW family protein [Ferrimonas sediminum]SDK12556.1 type IV pilus assembly protein PilW [Ferrimonas sediminum]